MNIILLKDVDGLGKKNDLVTVKNGYGRNFLIPKRMAVVANRSNKSQRDELTRQTNLKLNKMLDQIKAAVTQLESAPVKVGAKVGTSGKIFGSVTNVQLAEAIKKATGLEVDRRKITVLDEIKSLGTFKAEVDFHPEVKHELEFEVVAE